MNRHISHAVFALVTAFGLVSATGCKSDPQTQCTSQSYPGLACGSIQSCATSKDDKCSTVYLALPNGQKFDCAACGDCAAAQTEATTACGAGGEGVNAGEAPPVEGSGESPPEGGAEPPQGGAEPPQGGGGGDLPEGADDGELPESAGAGEAPVQ